MVATVSKIVCVLTRPPTSISSLLPPIENVNGELSPPSAPKNKNAITRSDDLKLRFIFLKAIDFLLGGVEFSLGFVDNGLFLGDGGFESDFFFLDFSFFLFDFKLFLFLRFRKVELLEVL